MKCTECKEKLVEYSEKLLSEQQQTQIAAHLESCVQCRQQYDQFLAIGSRITSDAQTFQSADLEQAVLNRIMCEQNKKLQQAEQSTHRLNLWSILMKKPFKLTAAAAILIAATLSLTLFNTTPAYAIRETIEALNAMRSIHIQMRYPGYEDPILVWATFHENGPIKDLRVSQSELAPGDPHDGAKEVALNNGIAQVWSKKTNTLYYIRSTEGVDKVSQLFRQLDPKQLVQKLQTMQKDGTAQLQIEQPENISEPIVITATFSKEDTLFGHKTTLLVDQATKLVLSLETQKGDGSFDPKTDHFGINDFSRIDFFDYNQPFAADTFTIDTPEDTMIIDRIENTVGLAAADRSIEETAVEVVNQFFESLIKQDYKTASLMYGGVPAEKIQEAFENQSKGEKILKVLSIGSVNIHPNPDYHNKAFIVPCTLEISQDQKTETKTYNCVVKEVEGQPGQWAICGGI